MSFLYRNGACSNNRPSKITRKHTPSRWAWGTVGICVISAVVQAQEIKLDVTQWLEFSDKPSLAAEVDYLGTLNPDLFDSNALSGPGSDARRLELSVSYRQDA